MWLLSALAYIKAPNYILQAAYCYDTDYTGFMAVHDWLEESGNINVRGMLPAWFGLVPSIRTYSGPGTRLTATEN